MPLQHIHDNMLERMRRETSRQYIADLICQNSRRRPGHRFAHDVHRRLSRARRKAISRPLLDFIRETKFERLGVFTYSQQDGTRAGAMAGQIPDRVKQQRRKLAMAAQRKVARHVSQSFVGREIKVLVEGRADAKQLQNASVGSWEHGFLRGEKSAAPPLAGRFLVARGEADAPDIDGRSVHPRAIAHRRICPCQNHRAYGL